MKSFAQLPPWAAYPPLPPACRPSNDRLAYILLAAEPGARHRSPPLQKPAHSSPVPACRWQEPRTHLPAYSRHEIEVLSSAQQNLLLPPSTYADLSPDARTRYRVLFQTAYLPPDYPIHPYFTRRVNSGPVFPFVAVLTAHHRQRLSQLSRTPAVTLHAQLSAAEYDLLAHSNVLTVTYH